MINREFVTTVMDRVNFPDTAKADVLAFATKLSNNAECEKQFCELVEEYMLPETGDPTEALCAAPEIGEKLGESEFTVMLLFWLVSSEHLLNRYSELGLPEEVFWASVSDLRCKLLECIECKGVTGVFVNGWFHGFFVPARYMLGRFEYDITVLSDDYTAPDGTVYKKGSPSLNCHIPSTGVPLTEDVRHDSHVRAYEFFKKYYPQEYGDGPLLITCNSWLLYPAHREFLPKTSNILGFMDDYDIVTSEETEGFSNDWRVYGRHAGLPYEQLPEDTSLRRAYKEHMIKTGVAGKGYGVIVFDGNKITNKLS